jgi:hypothetical protein
MPLLVRIDLVPGGFIEGSHEIARAVITRTTPLTDDAPSRGDYDITLLRYVGDIVESRRGQARDVERHENVWWFLQDLLESADWA